MVKLTSAYKNSYIKNREKYTNKWEEEVEIIFVFPLQIVLEKIGYIMSKYF